MMRALTIAACLAAATAASAQNQPSSAAPPETPVAAVSGGDALRGRQLTFTCQGCHGIPGYKNVYPTYHVPKIGGQSQKYLLNALTEYRQGKRKHPTMQAQAESFSEADIADIAAFLSGLK